MGAPTLGRPGQFPSILSRLPNKQRHGEQRNHEGQPRAASPATFSARVASVTTPRLCITRPRACVHTCRPTRAKRRKGARTSLIRHGDDRAVTMFPEDQVAEITTGRS